MSTDEKVIPIDDDFERSARESAESMKTAKPAARPGDRLRAKVAECVDMETVDYLAVKKGIAGEFGITPGELNSEVNKARHSKLNPDAVAKLDLSELETPAAAIIDSQDVLGMFARMMSKVIAGESNILKLLYLVATSRLFDECMSAAIKGTSAVGKSISRKEVLKFFPPEEVISFTSMSEKALIFAPESFEHKILSLAEATSTEEQTFQDYLIRELITEGCIRHLTTVKQGDRFVGEKIDKKGPVAFLVTTTKNKLHPENETRLLSLEIDDSERQTKAVLHMIANFYKHGKPDIDYGPWHDFQRWLAAGDIEVVIPFSDAVTPDLPSRAVRMRRDFPQLMDAIKCHALIHRQHRDRDEQGHIIADIENDYAQVRKLMNNLLAEGSGLAVDPAMQETIDAVAKATAGMSAVTGSNLQEVEGTNAIEVAKILKLDKSTALRRLQKAAGEGYVRNFETRRGQPGRYRTTGQKIEPVEMLPEPEIVSSFHTPPESTQPRNRTDFIEENQEETGCTSGCNRKTGCATAKPVATGDATAKPLGNNDKVPPVARLHGNTPPIEEEKKDASQKKDTGGENGGFDHDAIKAELQAQATDDLEIPEFLRRQQSTEGA